MIQVLYEIKGSPCHYQHLRWPFSHTASSIVSTHQGVGSMKHPRGERTDDDLWLIQRVMALSEKQKPVARAFFAALDVRTTSPSDDPALMRALLQRLSRKTKG